MKSISSLLVLFLALVGLLLSATGAAAWDSEDHEIFELQGSLESSFGKGSTFYSILNLTTSATSQEIRAAYRKRSMELHPDKHLGDPEASKRFERLGLVNKILRTERKDRYDYFLQRGFPKWRSTGYFYERFRPGFMSVVLGVLFLSALVEIYLIKGINFRKHSERVQRIRLNALYVAWGPAFYRYLLDTSSSSSSNGNANSSSSSSSNSKKGSPPQEKKVRINISTMPALPQGPSKEEVTSGKVDWDSVEKSVRRAALNNTSASSSSDGAPTPPVFLDLLVTYEQDGEGIVWIGDDDNAGEWKELHEGKLEKPTLLKDSWIARAIRRVTSSSSSRRGASGEADPTAGQQGAANGATSSGVQKNSNSPAATVRAGAKKNKKR